MSKISPVEAGLKQRCVTCGEGRVYARYLTFKPACEACGQDFSEADTADGPAFFVGFAVLIIFAPIGFIIPIADQPLWWKLVMFAVLVFATLSACLVMLPMAKSLLLALQIHNKAKPGERDSDV